MQEAPALPVLNKSYLFLLLPEDPQNPNRRYLQCPATGNIYCMSTGSLYQNISQINPLPTNISSFIEKKDFCALPSNPTSYTIPKSRNTNNPDHLVHGNGTTTPSIEINKNPGQCVQSNRLSIPQSNKAPNIKNADQHTKGNSTSKTPNVQRHATSKTNDGDEPIPGISALSTPKNPSKTSSNVKTDSSPATKKPKNKIKKQSKKSKDKSVRKHEHLDANFKNCQQLSKNEAKKQDKCTVQPQSKPTTPFIRTSSNVMYPTPIARITPTVFPSMLNPVIKKPLKSQTYNQSVYNPFQNSKKKSFTFHIINLQPMSEPAKRIHINLDHLLFPQRASPTLRYTQFSQKPGTTFEAGSSFTSINRCSSKPAKKPSLYFSREDYDMMNLENSFRKNTAKRKPVVKKTYNYKKIWKTIEPFNRRPYYHHRRKQRSLQGQYKNCIMASSVHEIIHSQFAKNANEHMPVSQIRAILSAGDRKLRKRPRWIQHMEVQAIQKYKTLKQKEDLEVEEYDVLHHLEKSWLVSYGRWVKNQKTEESWPLMVKCLHKHPNSTLQQACKHRSFCLRWNGKSYTLRMDHAYYTQIQCHMAVTDTSYAELIVHTHKETTILPVYFDLDFWKKTEVILETFFTNNISPYLKKFKKAPYLKKQTRKNNVRITGIPEDYTKKSLHNLVLHTIPKMLGLKDIRIEKAQRKGARLQTVKNSRPRPVIAKILDFNDKKEFINASRNHEEIKLGNNRIFISPDYPVEVRLKRRNFSLCCSILNQIKVIFSLLYPAKLRMYNEDGTMDTFEDPAKAMKFIEDKYGPLII
ncbi:uncharacterized protein RB166_004401 [Leptodactylus fuscus]